MRTEQVEIFSDLTNSVIMRHPDRRFPGFLLQGDALSILCREADKLCREIGRDGLGFEAANDLRNTLQRHLSHYKATLQEHDIKLPFSET